MLGLVHGRHQALQLYGSESAQKDWDVWRKTASRQTGDVAIVDGQVERREPRSELPPALALMSEHFASCLVFSLVMVTALFVTMMFLVRGIFSSPET